MITKKEKTREFILDKSYILFAKDGFNKITMKDICEVTNMSRGGLYSHFSSTKEIFEAILKKINQKDEMNFHVDIRKGVSATKIINNALELMEDEMSHPEDSLSLAMYEYSGSVDSNFMEYFTKIGEEKWTALIKYGIERGEFNNVNVSEIVNIILYAYQGVRMWSRIIPMTPEVFKSITTHIKKQLIKPSAVLYVHGKGGNANESEHYKSLFQECDVFGLDYHTFTPWQTGEEIKEEIKELKKTYGDIILVANSIGAYFSMNAGIDEEISRAYFISPIVNMEKLILDMMTWANITEEELQRKETIETEFGETLSWEYLSYVRNHPVIWNTKTNILYGSADNLTSLCTVKDFANAYNADLTVMEGGEHWFHTDDQMEFLDNWIKENKN